MKISLRDVEGKKKSEKLTKNMPKKPKTFSFCDMSSLFFQQLENVKIKSNRVEKSHCVILCNLMYVCG